MLDPNLLAKINAAKGIPATTTMATPGVGTAQSASTDALAMLNQAIPGFNGLSGQASSVVQNLLSGQPSPSTARNAAATFAAGNGLGTGGSGSLSDRWGYDLYNQQGQQRQQAGIQDLLGLLGGYSGTVTPTAGQNLQNQQYYYGQNQNQNQFDQAQGQQNNQFFANLNQNQNQFDQNLALNKFNAMLSGLGLGNSIVGNGAQLPSFNF